MTGETCPGCGGSLRAYALRPGWSRTDNETLVCYRCSVVEAMLAAGYSLDYAHSMADVNVSLALAVRAS